LLKKLQKFEGIMEADFGLDFELLEDLPEHRLERGSIVEKRPDSAASFV
jgi:hypothetical protein